MRGFSGIATFLSLPLAWSLAVPDSVPEIIGDEPSQQVPLEAPTSFFDSANPTSATWLPDGAVATSSLFSTTFTLADQPAAITSLPSPTILTSAFVTNLPVVGGTVNPHESSPRQDYQPDHRAQRPIGPVGKAWRTTLSKLASLQGLLCHHRDRSPVQIPIGGAQSDADFQTHDEIEDVPASSSSRSPSLPTGIQLAPSSVTGSMTLAATSLPTFTSIAAVSSDSSLTHDLFHNKKYLLAFVFSILATLTLSFSVCLFILRWNPRRRAERLAMWEECRNKRIYAKAAFKHRVNSWGAMTFGRLWFIGQGTQSTTIVDVGYDKELVVDSNYPSDIESDGGERLIREVRSFRTVHERVDALLRAEQGLSAASLRAKEKQQHPADRNRWRTYKWLFGGGGRRQDKRRRKPQTQRPRSGSAGSGSISCGTDIESLPSESEKSARTVGTAPPPYDENEKHKVIDDRFLLKVVTQGTAAAAAAQDTSDCSSLSSVIPTSPKEGSFGTLGSTDGHDML